jgi:SAM-dependent methyltransferase
MDKKDQLKKIYEIPFWRQKIELEPGVFTPGSSVFPELWEIMKLPENLNGLSFLDVGANDGLFSFLAEEKGAKKVVAVDIYSDSVDSSTMTEGWSSKCIETVKKYKNSNIQIRSNSLYDLEHWEEKFDIVFCSNVIIWLNDLFKAHKILSEITSSTLIIREDILLNTQGAQLRFSNLHRKNPTQGHFIGSKGYYREVLTKFGFNSITFLDIREDLIWGEYSKNHPVYLIKKGALIFESFDTVNSNNELEKEKSLRMSAKINDRLYFRGLGWVKKYDVKEIKPISTSKFRMNFKNFVKRISLKPFEANYIIIARKN